MSRPLRILFVVQGEGRGHMTQAIALKTILHKAGHEVVKVLVGASERREVPAFFYDKIGVPVEKFTSPNFATDSKGKGINIGKTMYKNFVLLPEFIKHVHVIENAMNECNPDLVINFFEPLLGLYYYRYRPTTPMICIAHQYMFEHHDFVYPHSAPIDRTSVKLFTKVTCFRAERKLALSFYPMESDDTTNVHAIPPLLRSEVYDLVPTTEDFFLMYVNNAGYSEDIIAWHAKNPDVELHCFWDKKDAPEEWKVRKNLTFHKIDDKKFLDMMARCKGLVTTAGFESVCEAMYLGKPVFMMPVQGHFEQVCNAYDAHRAGAGIFADNFDLDRFLFYVYSHSINPAIFRAWADQSAEMMVRHIEEVAG